MLRLARRSKNPEWRGGSVHEYLKVEGKAGYLNGVLIHYSYKDVSEHFRKTIEYAKLSSDDYFKTGKKFSILNLIFNPVAAFIRLYIINRGFLDGIRGLIAASSSFVYTFLKYAFLFEKTDGFQKYRYNDK